MDGDEHLCLADCVDDRGTLDRLRSRHRMDEEAGSPRSRRDLGRDLAEIVRDPPFAEIVVTLGEIPEGWPGSGDLHVAIHAR